MKANELMIGDWVKQKHSGLLLKVCAIEPPYVRADGEDGQFHEDTIEPISVTEEMLEKNGFTKRKDVQWVIEKKRIVGCCGQTCGNTNPMVYVIWVDKGYMGIVNYHPEATITKAGSHVHKLQQCIRLCGIDKEIVLT